MSYTRQLYCRKERHAVERKLHDTQLYTSVKSSLTTFNRSLRAAKLGKQASELQIYWQEQNLTQNGHSRSRVIESEKRR